MYQRVAGMTLLELLITLAVGITLASLALPVFSRQVATSQRIAATNTLVGLVQMARAESIKQARDVVLCPSPDGEHCATDWTAGYLVFIDDPPGPPYALNDPELRLHAGRWPERMTVVANRNPFVFRPLARRSSNGTFRLCHPALNVAPRAVIVAPSGRPRISTRLPDGREIPCPRP